MPCCTVLQIKIESGSFSNRLLIRFGCARFPFLFIVIQHDALHDRIRCRQSQIDPCRRVAKCGSRSLSVNKPDIAVNLRFSAARTDDIAVLVELYIHIDGRFFGIECKMRDIMISVDINLPAAANRHRRARSGTNTCPIRFDIHISRDENIAARRIAVIVEHRRDAADIVVRQKTGSRLLRHPHTDRCVAVDDYMTMIQRSDAAGHSRIYIPISCGGFPILAGNIDFYIAVHTHGLMIRRTGNDAVGVFCMRTRGSIYVDNHLFCCDIHIMEICVVVRVSFITASSVTLNTKVLL